MKYESPNNQTCHHLVSSIRPPLQLLPQGEGGGRGRGRRRGHSREHQAEEQQVRVQCCYMSDTIAVKELLDVQLIAPLQTLSTSASRRSRGGGGPNDDEDVIGGLLVWSVLPHFQT